MSATASSPPPGERRDLGNPRAYVRVLIIQAVVLLALWLFSRHFG